MFNTYLQNEEHKSIQCDAVDLKRNELLRKIIKLTVKQLFAIRCFEDKK